MNELDEARYNIRTMESLVQEVGFLQEELIESKLLVGELQEEVEYWKTLFYNDIEKVEV